MTRRVAILIAAALGLASGVFLFRLGPDSTTRNEVTAEEGSATPVQSADASPPAIAATSTPPFAERILADYANPARPPEDDLRDLARTLENLSLLVKGDRPLPLGANEEIGAALRGKNKAALRALPDGHRVFNAQGQLVDRWGTPLYFHAESRDRLDIRSAGPDRQMWTADDLHRQADGRFLRGEALLPPSLFSR